MDQSSIRRRKEGTAVTEVPVKNAKSAAAAVSRENARCHRCALFLAAALCLCVGYLAYAYVTSPVNATVVRDFPDLASLDWPFETNTLLQRGEKLHPDIVGPESVVYDENGNLYTGLKNGAIVRIRKIADKYSDILETVVSTDEFLQSIGEKIRTKMRPLGLRYIAGKIYLTDAYQGVLVYDLKANRGERLVKYDDVQPPMQFTDDLVVTKDGKTIYFTDGSSRWQYHQMTFSATEGECTGRLFKYDFETGRVSTLLRGLCFANGVELSGDETKLLIAETSRCRLHVLDLATLKFLKTTILPGGPDNIRASSDGGYWVGVPLLHDATLDLFHRFPVVRSILAGVFGAEGLFVFGNLKRGVVAKLDRNGDVVDVLYDLEGKLSRAVTQATELENGDLILGSFVASGIAYVDLQKSSKNT